VASAEPRLIVAIASSSSRCGNARRLNGGPASLRPSGRAVAPRRQSGPLSGHGLPASGGGTLGTDPAKATYSVPELSSATETAHAFGLPTTAHCRASESMTRAIDAGLDCMEHGELIAPDGTRRFDHDLARRLVVLAVYQDGELVSG